MTLPLPLSHSLPFPWRYVILEFPHYDCSDLAVLHWVRVSVAYAD